MFEQHQVLEVRLPVLTSFHVDESFGGQSLADSQEELLPGVCVLGVRVRREGKIPSVTSVGRGSG